MCSCSSGTKLVELRYPAPSTTARYTKRTSEQLAEAAERLTF
jgi:hypothetical protein